MIIDALPLITDNACDHGPESWADLARKFEREDMFANAATAWTKARTASIGHKRRDRYEIEAARCRALAE